MTSHCDRPPIRRSRLVKAIPSAIFIKAGERYTAAELQLAVRPANSTFES
jgi:hypothetical protein